MHFYVVFVKFWFSDWLYVRSFRALVHSWVYWMMMMILFVWKNYEWQQWSWCTIVSVYLIYFLIFILQENISKDLWNIVSWNNSQYSSLKKTHWIILNVTKSSPRNHKVIKQFLRRNATQIEKIGHFTSKIYNTKVTTAC